MKKETHLGPGSGRSLGDSGSPKDAHLDQNSPLEASDGHWFVSQANPLLLTTLIMGSIKHVIRSTCINTSIINAR